MKPLSATLAITFLLPLGMACGDNQLCPDGVLESGVQVLGGGIWVGASVVPPWMVDEDGGSIVRIGDVGASPLQSCRVLTGGVTLGGGMPLVPDVGAQTRMPAFDGLEEVGRNITWVNFHPSDTVDAFNNLTRLGGGVSIQGGVGDMAGFNSLESMAFLDGSRFTTGYQSLRTVDDFVDVRNEISGLGELEFIGGDLTIVNEADPSCLQSLEEGSGSIRVDSRGPSTLTFPSLSMVGRDFILEYSSIEENEETSIHRIGGAVFIHDNTGLDSADALDWVRSIPEIDGRSELADALGQPYLVCNNLGTAGNCEGEENFNDSQ